ncbi:alpha/beta hydrolase family protein [Streptomyces sp. MMG1121]|uniref:alpha/beta hydrolase family protein n=1 Tax=Streptomyces sp. MMG1121 TaxID=1415544 RepID=UPI0006ADED0C|nr:Tat pathway signal protein [Streptomyces sp. MMG1121]KOV60543.1 Tat pathway signal protein [Streptomyces sp. MMG1121]
MTNRHPHRRRTAATWLRALAACAVAPLCALATALPAGAAVPPADAAVPAATAASPARQLTLPVPSGRHHVGAVPLHLVDRSRPGPWQPGQKYRELMITVYYPTTRTTHHPPAPYMLPAAATHFDQVTANDYLGMDLPVGRADWAGTVTHVATGAPVAAGRSGHLPVVLYSPGLGEPRTWGTTLAADLAGHGYVVVTVDNTYESPEVQFPNGTLATMSPPADPDAYVRKSLAIRVADTSFVLDQLQSLDSGRNPDADGRRLPDGLAGALDLSEVGMFGHSMGGTAAAQAMDADHRIAAGINMDGNLTNIDGSLMPVAQHGLDRPFLLLGKDGDTDTGPGWQAFRAHTPGWTRQLTLRGSEHASFTDAEALLPQLHLPCSVRTADLGTISPTTAIRTNEAYVSAYFDHWLRGGSGELLEGPSAKYPDMMFVN